MGLLWDSKPILSLSGSVEGSGFYFCKFEAVGFKATMKLGRENRAK